MVDVEVREVKKQGEAPRWNTLYYDARRQGLRTPHGPNLATGSLFWRQPLLPPHAWILTDSHSTRVSCALIPSNASQSCQRESCTSLTLVHFNRCSNALQKVGGHPRTRRWLQPATK